MNLALVFVVAGAFLQLGGLWLTVHQVRLVIGIRSTVRKQARDLRHRLLGRTRAPKTVRRIQAHATGTGTVRVEVSVVGESDVDRLDRVTKHHEKLIAELDRKLIELDHRAQRALDGRLDELDRETTEKASRNAALMWWGVVLIGAGIIMQTAGSLL